MRDKVEDKEQKDLVVMKAANAEDMDTAFSCMQMIERMSPAELKHSGHKTKEDGLVWTVRDTLKKINARVQEHLRKYPD